MGSYQISQELSHSVRAYQIPITAVEFIDDFLYFQIIQSFIQFSTYSQQPRANLFTLWPIIKHFLLTCLLILHLFGFSLCDQAIQLKDYTPSVISFCYGHVFMFKQYPWKVCLILYDLIYTLLYQKMDPKSNDINEIKNSIKASVFKRSYIGGFHNPESLKKSSLQKDHINEQQIDDKTLKVMVNFVKPSQNVTIYKQTGRCHIETNSFFSCFSSRKVYEFELNNSRFSVTSQDKIARYVDFNVVWAHVQSKGEGISITFQANQREIYLELVGPKKVEDTQKLLKNLNDLIKQTDGTTKRFTYLNTKNPLDFYKTQHVLNSEFEQCANSCDIILFKSQHSAAAVQRIFTDSEYDHVGVILRNKKNQLFIYESTSDIGVGLTSWKQFIRYEWYTQIDKICWKPLNIKLTSADADVIEKFVVKTLGKEFQLNIDKLLTFKSTLARTEEEQKNKTYFCSELVARLYKELGIINEEKSSTSYYPVDFSDKGAMKIIREGVSLGNERLISFDKA